jgi:hypothetical protein
MALGGMMCNLVALEVEGVASIAVCLLLVLSVLISSPSS